MLFVLGSRPKKMSLLPSTASDWTDGLPPVAPVPSKPPALSATVPAALPSVRQSACPNGVKPPTKYPRSPRTMGEFGPYPSPSTSPSSEVPAAVPSDDA